MQLWASVSARPSVFTLRPPVSSKIAAVLPEDLPPSKTLGRGGRENRSREARESIYRRDQHGAQNAEANDPCRRLGRETDVHHRPLAFFAPSCEEEYGFSAWLASVSLDRRGPIPSRLGSPQSPRVTSECHRPKAGSFSTHFKECRARWFSLTHQSRPSRRRAPSRCTSRNS